MTQVSNSFNIHPSCKDVLSALESGGYAPRKQGSGHIARCPAHDDHDPSLNIAEKKDGSALLHCFSNNCDYESILKAIGLWTNPADIERKDESIVPYHTSKQVKLHSPAYLDSRNNVVVPLMPSGQLTIWTNGNKRVLKGTDTNESLFFFAGDKYEIEQALSFCVATGYSTAASIYESTGCITAMAVSDDNIPTIVEKLRKRFPNTELTICADYDARDKFTFLALNNNCRLCYAPVVNGILKPHTSDFNDLMIDQGKSAVCEVVGEAKFVTADSVKVEVEKPTATKTNGAVMFLDADKIIPKPIEWVWNGWLAIGKLMLLAGAPGTGKTSIALTIGATISRGGQLPDGTNVKEARVLIWSSEDDPTDTLIPRLIAANAKLSNIKIIQSVNTGKDNRCFDPSKDFPLLETAVKEIGNVGFMVIDSIADSVSGDAGKNNQVRRALAPVKEFAENNRIAVLGITHFNKNVNGKAMSRIIDSVAFTGMPRVVMIAFKKKDNGSLLMRAKSNIGPDHGGYEYHTYMEPLIEYPGIVANRIGWGGYIEGSADQHLTDAESPIIEDPKKEYERAEQFLLDELADGLRKESALISDKAKSLGISRSVLDRAKQSLRIEPKKIGKVWYMYLPVTNNSEEPPF